MGTGRAHAVPSGPCHDSQVEEQDKAAQELNKARATRPTAEEFKRFLATGWGVPEDVNTTAVAGAPFAAERRARLSAMFPGARIVIPAGDLKVPSNDTAYRFRPHSDFPYLTGLGVDFEPGAVLVMTPF